MGLPWQPGAPPVTPRGAIKRTSTPLPTHQFLFLSFGSPSVSPPANTASHVLIVPSAGSSLGSPVAPLVFLLLYILPHTQQADPTTPATTHLLVQKCTSPQHSA